MFVDQRISGLVREGDHNALPVTELLLERAPILINHVLLQLRASQVRAVIGLYRVTYVPFNVFPVEDGPQPQVAIERAERVLSVGQLQVGARDAFQVPIPIAGALDVSARRQAGCIRALYACRDDRDHIGSCSTLMSH